MANINQIVTRDLKLYYDFGNMKKSFKGPATTNLFAVPTPDSSGNVTFALNGTGTFQRLYSGTYGGYTITSNDVVYKYNLGLSGCHYHGNNYSLTNGDVVRFSCDYYVSPDAANYPTINHIANSEGPSAYGVGDPSPYYTGVWKSFLISYTASASQSYNFLLYPGACSSSYLASSGYILYKNPQVEIRSFNTEFVGPGGSRTAATGLLDLTGNRTTSTLTVTYPSGQTPYTYPYLNSTNSAVITDSSNILDTDQHSIFFMIRFNSTGSYPNGWSGSWDKIFTFAPAGTDRAPGIWRYTNQRYLHWRYDPNNSGCDFGKDVANNDFDLNTWYYVGVTKSGSDTVQYVNGVAIKTTGSIQSPKTTGSAAIYLFESYPTDLASMGLIQIYNRPLLSYEVQQNFAAIRGRYGI